MSELHCSWYVLEQTLLCKQIPYFEEMDKTTNLSNKGRSEIVLIPLF